MNDERCEMCKAEGFPDILAHYKGVPAGGSSTGKAIPALCFDHKHGRVRKHLEKLRQERGLGILNQPLTGNARQDAVGLPPPRLSRLRTCARCGSAKHRGSCKGMKGHHVPEPQVKPIGVCRCGCGEPTNRDYIWGHRTKKAAPAVVERATVPKKSEYADVVAALELKRDHITAAIDALRALE
jgi:hypothetical protein